MGFLDMDTYTFSRHFRNPRTRFEVLQRYLEEGGLESDHSQVLPIAKMVLMFRWYMANQNSFREFNVSRSSAHRAILRVLTIMSLSTLGGALSLGLHAVRRGCLPPSSNAHVALRGSYERLMAATSGSRSHRSEDWTT
ncbi:unnamed protein product [Arctogadus glacialis]